MAQEPQRCLGTPDSISLTREHQPFLETVKPHLEALLSLAWGGL